MSNTTTLADVRRVFDLLTEDLKDLGLVTGGVLQEGSKTYGRTWQVGFTPASDAAGSLLYAVTGSTSLSAWTKAEAFDALVTRRQMVRAYSRGLDQGADKVAALPSTDVDAFRTFRADGASTTRALELSSVVSV